MRNYAFKKNQTRKCRQFDWNFWHLIKFIRKQQKLR